MLTPPPSPSGLERLERSLSLLSAVLESTADALLVTDLEGRPVMHNQKFVSMWQVPPQMLASEKANELVTFLLYQLKAHEAYMEHVRRAVQQPDLEWRDELLLVDGRVVECVSTPERLSGQIVGRVQSFRDVTERRRAEQEVRLLQALILASSEAEDLEAAMTATLRIICDAAGWSMGQAWVPAGGVLACSPAWYTRSMEMDGFRAASEALRLGPGEDVPGRAWDLGQAVWVPDYTLDEASARVASAPHEDLWSALAVPVVASSGVVAVLEFFMGERREEDERLVRFVTSAAQQLGNLFERRRTQDALRASEQRFEAIFDSLPYAVAFADASGRVSLTNPAFGVIFGFSEEQILGQPLTVMVAEDFSALAPEAIAETARNPRELLFLRRNGEEFSGEMAGTRVLDPSGALLGTVVIVRDITERKRLEEQLRESQKMDAIGQLAGGLAHDFNNMLTVIYGYSSMMLRAVGPNEVVRDCVERVRQATAKASALTRQLLAFSRKQVLQPVVLDLNGVLADMDTMLRTVLGEGIEVDMRLTPELGRVKADPGQMEQAIVNLAVNARDAMAGRGTLRIEVSDVSVVSGDVPDGEYVRLDVVDTGHGMDEETAKRIFEPFFTTKERGRGTGLGLSMVYGIVTQSGGHIRVDSEIGKGTTFSIYLPRVNEMARKVERPSLDGEPPRGTETVLLAEDQDAVRELVRDMLERHGYSVLSAGGGTAALSLASSFGGTIHLLLTDVVMPDMNGRELALKLTSQLSGLRVLYTSGYADDHVVRHGILEPDVELLEKPFTEETLVRRVRQVLDRKG